MHEIFPFLVPITLFASIAAVAILRGPLGKALGERLAGGSVREAPSAEVDALRNEVEDLRYRLTDMEERLDFTERILARQREHERLPPGE
jgi:hypothetical protein